MEKLAIYNFFNALRDDSLSFLYRGFLSDEFTEQFISLSESNIEKLQEPKGVRNKVSFLIAESFQNIIRHGESLGAYKCSYSKPGIFILRIINNQFVISTTNLIRKEDAINIEGKIAQINSLDDEEIKTLFSEILGSNEMSEKGGAGLGLLEMARKSGNKLDYDFEKLNDEFSFFYLQMSLTSKPGSTTQLKRIPIAHAKEFYEILSQNNTYLTYKGDFSQDNILTLLKIIERNLQINPFEHISIKSLIYVALTELFQNISKHAFSKKHYKEGIFLLGKYINKYVLSTGNYISNDKIPAFEDKIAALNRLTKDELTELYIHKLRSSEVDMDGNAGLGFIELAKECGQIDYHISRIDDECSFLNINIQI